MSSTGQCVRACMYAWNCGVESERGHHHQMRMSECQQWWGVGAVQQA